VAVGSGVNVGTAAVEDARGDGGIVVIMVEDGVVEAVGRSMILEGGACRLVHADRRIAIAMKTPNRRFKYSSFFTYYTKFHRRKLLYTSLEQTPAEIIRKRE
jgi:hypothetical protein